MEDLSLPSNNAPPPPPHPPPCPARIFFNHVRGAEHCCRRRGAGEESLFAEMVQATGANLFQAGGNKKAGPGCQNTRWSPLPDVTTRSEASPLLSPLGLSVGGGRGKGGGGEVQHETDAEKGVAMVGLRMEGKIRGKTLKKDKEDGLKMKNPLTRASSIDLW